MFLEPLDNIYGLQRLVHMVIVNWRGFGLIGIDYCTIFVSESRSWRTSGVIYNIMIEFVIFFFMKLIYVVIVTVGFYFTDLSVYSFVFGKIII